MLGPAHSVKFHARPVRTARGGVFLVDLNELVRGRSRNLRDQFRGIAGIMLLQELENAVRVLKGGILEDHAVLARLIGPGLLVVLGPFQTREDAVVVPGELEGGIHQEGGVGIVLYILVKEEVVVDDVLDHAAEEGDVRPRADGCVNMGLGRRLGEPWVNAQQSGASLVNGFLDPLEGNRVIGSGVASHDQDHIRIAEVDPVIRHCAASERLCQSRYSWAVSDPGLVFNIDQTQAP